MGHPVEWASKSASLDRYAPPRQFTQQRKCLIPTDARVGDALTVGQRLALRSFCAPATRLLSIITPMILRLPAAICAAMSWQTTACRRWSFLLLA